MSLSFPSAAQLQRQVLSLHSLCIDREFLESTGMKGPLQGEKYFRLSMKVQVEEVS